MNAPAVASVTPVGRWSRRQGRCSECGCLYEATWCPTCGPLPNAERVEILGVVTETPNGDARLSLVEVVDGQRVVHQTRPLTGEQLRWLRRQASPQWSGELC